MEDPGAPPARVWSATRLKTVSGRFRGRLERSAWAPRDRGWKILRHCRWATIALSETSSGSSNVNPFHSAGKWESSAVAATRKAARPNGTMAGRIIRPAL